MGTIFTPEGRPGSISLILALTLSMTSRAFWPWRMMTMPETASPLPSRSETPLRRSGPMDHLPDVLDAYRRSGIARRDDDVLQVLDGLEIAASPYVVFGSAELDEAPADFIVAASHRLHHAVDGYAVGLQPVRVHVHLVLLPEPPDGRDLGDARDRFQVVLEVPVLVGAQLCQAVLAGLVHQDVLKDPAQGRGIRSHLRSHALGKAGQHGGKVFQGARPGPVDVRAVLEDHVDIGVAEIGETADSLDPGGAHQGRHDGIGHLVFDDVRAPVPAGENNHLGVAEVRDGIEGQVFHGPPACHAGDGHQGEDEEFVVYRKIDDAVDHIKKCSCLGTRKKLCRRSLRGV